METCGAARVVQTLGARALVEVNRHEACSHCTSADLCQVLSGRGTLRLEVENPIGAREGQVVELLAARSLGLRAAFFVYLLPALLFLCGVILGSEGFRWPPWGAGLLGLALLAGSWFIARVIDRGIRRRNELCFTISRVLDQLPPSAR
ncbi:MAG: SoxR reducing system RseC family protein [Candidatus Eisenbacteria sp.]|nr:SoxR reducing system RseC family protein [Candidatus Eisenbacteria bacterium]